MPFDPVSYMIGKKAGGGIPLLTRSEWDNLNSIEKQKYDLIAVQDKDSGYRRGILYSGSSLINTLLIESSYSKILAEAMCEYFDAGMPTWGNLTLTGYQDFTLKDDGSINLSGNSQSMFYDLGEANMSVTNYLVFKSLTNSNTSRLISNVYANSSGNAPGFYRNTSYIYYTYYAGDTNTNVLAINNYHVIAESLSAGSSKKATFFVDGIKVGSLTPSNIGRYTEFTATLKNGSSFIYGGNTNIKYAAVVSGAETDEVIIENMQNIMRHYNLT